MLLATEWVTRLTDARRAERLTQELARLQRYGLIIVEEVGYLPLEQDAANLLSAGIQPVRTGFADPHVQLLQRLGRCVQ